MTEPGRWHAPPAFAGSGRAEDGTVGAATSRPGQALELTNSLLAPGHSSHTAS
jgi:hypothetical protein